MRTIFLLAALLVSSAQLPAQIDLQLELISDAFGGITDIANAGDDRLFVVEKAGRIRILQANGQINNTAFLDISGQVSTDGERGLLGLVFHPDYPNNGYFFINYTNKDGNTVLARYQVASGDPALADPNSESILLTINQPYDNHNGGDLNFGPDGYLYISTGDGGSGGDPQDKAQDLTTLLGKILRIDVNSGPGSDPDYSLGSGYTIPNDNPLIDGAGGTLDEIWALGLRNPWRFSFDRQSGDMWIGDVGQEQLEEINFEPAGSPGGLNYGWRCYEGSQTYNLTNCGAASSYTFPAYEYGHDVGCSVNGGYVYRGKDYPSLYGLYLYSDYCTGRIWSLKNENGEWVSEELLRNAGGQFVTMGEDKRGELYFGSLNGSVYRVVDAGCTSDDSDLEIDDNPIASGTYQAGDSLSSAGTVAADAEVTFIAGNTIVLEAGFQAQANSTFRAMIGNCAPTANSVSELPEPEARTTLPPTLDLQVFPNPFRSETTIRYTLPEAASVDIRVWDLYGNAISRPVAQQKQEAGVYDVTFSQPELPAGVYLLVIRAGAAQRIGRMEIIR